MEVAHGGTRRSSLAEVHQTRSLEPIDITTIDHIPVTRVPRTLFDLADDHRIEDAVDDALCRRLVTLDRLSRRNEALKARGRSNLDAVLRTWTPGGMPDSVAEMRLVRRLVAHGLPEPERQVVINGLRVDLLYSEEKVILELDSFRWHGAPRGHARTMARQRELVAAGYAVLPVTVADLRGDGADLCDQVKSLLGLRAIPRLASGGR